MRDDDELRGATEAWLEAEAERPDDVPAADWLRWEQDKHERLLRRRPTTGDRMTTTAPNVLTEPTSRSPTSAWPSSAARRSGSPSTRCPA